MSWISLADEVAAIRYLLDAGRATCGGPSTSPRRRRSRTRCSPRRWAGCCTGRRSSLCPRFGPKLLLGSELAETLLYEGQRVLPDVLIDAGFEFRHTDLEPTLRELLR